MNPTPRALSVADLETTYDLFAEAIDGAGPEKAQLFLVKLVLLQANAIADVDAFRDQLGNALADLGPHERRP